MRLKEEQKVDVIIDCVFQAYREHNFNFIVQIDEYQHYTEKKMILVGNEAEHYVLICYFL